MYYGSFNIANIYIIYVIIMLLEAICMYMHMEINNPSGIEGYIIIITVEILVVVVLII
jgi:hypothetical protein